MTPTTSSTPAVASVAGPAVVTVIVFAKAPVPGEVKTRLIPRLGARGAAALHAALVERALETACSSRVGPVELCCAPDASHPFFAVCAERSGVAVTAQTGGNLGARMHAAFERIVPDRGHALLIGSDCPALTIEQLREAAAALQGGHDAVLGPAEDGGYVLVGLARTSPEVFDGIVWSGPDVMRDTRARLGALGWRWHELAELWDVDRPDDLARLAERIDGGARYVEAALHAAG
jgi:rSAM/selenodomain-associated transferase 1